MKNNVEVQAEIGLCTKEMAHENPLKDFEILVEEYKGKWSNQMYEYFKECVEVLKKKEKSLEIIKEKAVNIYYVEITNNYINYNRCIDEFFGNYEHRDVFYLTKEEFDLLKEVLLHD